MPEKRIKSTVVIVYVAALCFRGFTRVAMMIPGNDRRQARQRANRDVDSRDFRP
jgi:hypothetical protein